MTYLVVDPQTFLLTEDSRQAVDELLAHVVYWARIADKYDITFGMTQACADALVRTPHSVFNPDFIEDLTRRYPHLTTADIWGVVTPLLEQLRTQQYLDDTLAELEDSRMSYEVEDVMMSPPQHLTRLKPASLMRAFKQMLGLVVFARKHGIVPLSALDNIRILTRYSKDELRDWATALLVRIIFSWTLDESVTNREEREKVREFMDEFETIWSPDAIENLPRRTKMVTLMDAVRAATACYPRQLIASTKTEEAARHSGYPPQAMYTALCGLIEVWLPAYQRGGDVLANAQYHARFGHAIKSTESSAINNTPRLWRERMASYNGEEYYCQRHVMLGRGHARIYFHVFGERGQEKIILAGVGRHAATSRDRT